MEKLFLSVENDGFYGTYYENPKGSDCVVIGLFGDDPPMIIWQNAELNGFIKTE